MADFIHYNYGQNYAQLDGIKSHLNDATALREEVHKVFTALADIYQGEAATALHTAHQQTSQAMDQVIGDIHGTHTQAVDRQEITQVHDHQLAGGF